MAYTEIMGSGVDIEINVFEEWEEKSAHKKQAIVFEVEKCYWLRPNFI